LIHFYKRKDQSYSPMMRILKVSPQCLLFTVLLCAIFIYFQGKLSSDNLEILLNGQCTKNCDKNSLLVNFIRDEMVKPSGVEPVLENPEGAKTKGQTGQVDAILKHFNNKKNGFFIEAGAWDGEHLSNTIYLETQLGWSGLLVEPNRGAYDLLVAKKRNAHSISSCLATNGYAERVRFDSADVFGGIDDVKDPAAADVKEERDLYAGSFGKDLAREMVTVQCFPLYSILLALGNPRVDFFSLDIEGSEMKVLRTIPFDKVDIEIFLIETNKVNVTEMTEFMAGVGYQVTEMPPYDHLFVKQR